MTTAYTPTAQIATSNPATHADGDDGNATNFNRPLEPLLDARAFVRSLAPGMLLWRGLFAVDTGGSSSSFTVRFSPIEAVVLPDGSGTLYVFESTAAEVTIGLSKVDGSPGNLSNSTWYYVYAYRNAGSLDYLISTTAPDVYLTFRNGAQTHRYIGCFVTDSSGAPIPMRAHKGRYLYRRSALANNQTRALNTSTVAGSATNLSLAGQVPPHSRLAMVQTQITNSGGASLMLLYTDGDTSDAVLRHDNQDGITSTRWSEIETSSAQVLDYTLTISAGTATATLHVAGFSE
jgi:hypothetical protein